MATILSENGRRYVVYSNDHRPAHVHVISADHEALFELNCPQGPPSLRENYGFPKKLLNEIKRVLSEHLAEACAAWKKIHG